MSNPVGWFEIYVDDLARAQAFYQAVFGIQLSKLDTPGIDMLAFPMQGDQYGAAGALVRMSGFPAGNNSVIVYFSCVDCALEENRALQNGGKVQKSKMSIGPYGFISLVIDTEGNLIGLHSQR